MREEHEMTFEGVRETSKQRRELLIFMTLLSVIKLRLPKHGFKKFYKCLHLLCFIIQVKKKKKVNMSVVVSTICEYAVTPMQYLSCLQIPERLSI